MAETEAMQKQFRRADVTIQQRQPDGTLVRIEFGGRVTNYEGDPVKIGEAVLEAEMHGNDGKSRIHISLRG